MVRVAIGLGEGILGLLLVLLGIYYAPINDPETSVGAGAAAVWLMAAGAGTVLGVLGVREEAGGRAALTASALLLGFVGVLILIEEPTRVTSLLA